jgi:hypothetical protein
MSGVRENSGSGYGLPAPPLQKPCARATFVVPLAVTAQQVASK